MIEFTENGKKYLKTEGKLCTDDIELNINVPMNDTDAVHYIADSGKTDTQKQQARTNIGAGTYSKPDNGIPSTDLTSAVQTKLNDVEGVTRTQVSASTYQSKLKDSNIILETTNYSTSDGGKQISVTESQDLQIKNTLASGSTGGNIIITSTNNKVELQVGTKQKISTSLTGGISLLNTESSTSPGNGIDIRSTNGNISIGGNSLSGTVSITGQHVTVPTPTNDSDASTKAYADTKVSIPSSSSSGDALIYDGSVYNKQSGYGYTKLSTSSAVFCDDTYSFFYIDTYGKCIAPNITPALLGIVSGNSYTVTWGTGASEQSYTCVAKTPMTGIVTLGNLYLMNSSLPNTGEPFIYATKFTAGDITYTSVWATAETSSTPHYIRVEGIGNITEQIDDKYLLKSNFSNGKGSYCANIGFNNNASGFACIANGSDNEASGFVSYAEGSHTISSEAYTHSQGYQTQATARYSSAAGYYSVASGALSNAEGERTTASGYCSRTFGRENTADGSYSIAEGRGNSTSTDFQHMFGQYGVTGTGARITGWGTSSTHKNIEKLDTSGNLRLAGNVYVGCGTDSTGGTLLNPGIPTVITDSNCSTYFTKDSNWKISTGANDKSYIYKNGNMVYFNLTFTYNNDSADTTDIIYFCQFNKSGYKCINRFAASSIYVSADTCASIYNKEATDSSNGYRLRLVRSDGEDFELAKQSGSTWTHMTATITGWYICE